jgi:hypothetical protein
MGVKPTLRRAGWVVFVSLAALFLSVIGYGVAKTPLHYQKRLQLVRDERLLAPDARDPDLGLELRVVGLRDAPALRVKMAGLASAAPLRVWLTGADDGRAPLPLAQPVSVEGGKTDARIPLPEQGIRRYKYVIGVQGRRVLFRAPLT